jgi:hypothetical protein
MPSLQMNTTGLPHLGRIVQRELLSVVLPGVLVLIEIWLLVASPADIHDNGGYLKYASGQTSHVNPGVLVIAILLGAISAYGVGLVLRMLTWRLFEHVPGHQDIPRGPEILKLLKSDFGDKQVKKVLALHESLRLALYADSPSATRRSKRKVGKQIDDLVPARDEFMSYCKSWLRLHQPGLGVDHLEAQINFLVTLTPPLLLGPFVVYRHHTSWWCLAVSRLVAGGVAWAFVSLSWIRRTWEPIDAVRYFFLAHWFDEAKRLDKSLHREELVPYDVIVERAKEVLENIARYVLAPRTSQRKA